MDLTTITVDDFKAQFPRDFPYLPVWLVANQPYNIGDRVYYEPQKLFYDANVNGVTTEPPSSDWTLATDSIDNYVQDSDIERAFLETQVNFNQSVFGTDAEITLVYLYLAAHYLVHDLRASAGGISAQVQFPVSSKSVGSISESYGIPQTYLDNPVFSFFATTPYGLKYLSFAMTRTVGNVVSVHGAVNP
ncbi:MAG: hypothetical protein COB09_18850 [Thalassobium sp.]|nr:MAG: hypothetical protein COB09_18850 [Thalassobium sp.]